MQESLPEALYVEALPLERHRHLASHLFVMKDCGRFTAPSRSLFATQLRELAVTNVRAESASWRASERAPRFGHQPRSRPLHGWMVGVRSPGSAPSLLTGDSDPVTARLLERLPLAAASSSPFEQIVRALDSFLDDRMEAFPAGRTTPALGALAANDLFATVAALATAAGLSARTVQRHVSARLGMPPKRWLGVGRFQRALRRIALGEDSLAEVAIDEGYTDQAHLTTEIKRHTGMTPGRLRGSTLHELSPVAVRFLQDEALRRRLLLVLSPDS